VIYTLDTNAITAFLTRRGDVARIFEDKLVAGHDVTLNAISFELKRGLVLSRFTRKLTEFEEFAGGYELLPLDMPALNQAVTIYQTLRAAGRLLEDADSFIAATAMAHDATLVTRNLKHFERVEGLCLESLVLNSWEA